jgi:integrase
VRVSAGHDPVTGERIILTDSVMIDRPGNGRSERAAFKEAEKRRTKLLAEADELRVARTRTTVGALVERWMGQHEIDATTRMTYEAQVRLYIIPNLGDVPLTHFARDASERLEVLYGRLRRCRGLCSGRPSIERHATDGPHDCAEVRCKPHVCKPYAASSIRSINAILSGACGAAVRWGWLTFNPVTGVRLPSKPRPQPRPPSSDQMAKIIETAWRTAPWWGLYLWVSAVLGARRGEVVALQWEDVDLQRGVIRLDENYVRAPNGMVLKDTKNHQMRRVSIDTPTVELLQQHKMLCVEKLAAAGGVLSCQTWLFSARPDFSRPRDPASLTRRYSLLVAKLGVNTSLKELRHYSATELLTSGVDLRTVAGRLGHGDGTTTLRFYAAWVGAADQAAAATIGGRMPHIGGSSRTVAGDQPRSQT